MIPANAEQMDDILVVAERCVTKDLQLVDQSSCNARRVARGASQSRLQKVCTRRVGGADESRSLEH